MDYGRKHAHQSLFVAHQLLEEEMMQDFALFLRVNIKRVQRGNYTMALVSLGSYLRKKLARKPSLLA